MSLIHEQKSRKQEKVVHVKGWGHIPGRGNRIRKGLQGRKQRVVVMGLVEIKTNQKRISKDHLLKGLSHRHVHFGRYSKAISC